ncbi:MAG: hypothetical protein ACPGUE_10370 [Marinomonas sp.]|uniref:hypothetical protein n=1 Tax=unclassified Marinomonas TaxID=196814 RepID=UPI0007AFE011|nr:MULTISPECIES: hypothetical protein [unclassified Marinomonas]KZM38769.1 hypothetical protein OA91_23445 [Marinomonas sp. SBI8L]KZM43767.1 hypothetical protein OA92_08855 [Marinomonas sp. SBI22]
MLLGELPFGTFEEVEPKVMEITINQGVQVSEKNIEEIEQGLLEKYQDKYALLINRKNAYSHGHESLARIGELKNVSAIAILVYSEPSLMAAKIHLVYSNNVQIFTNRNAAINWLRNCQ